MALQVRKTGRSRHRSHLMSRLRKAARRVPTVSQRQCCQKHNMQPVKRQQRTSGLQPARTSCRWAHQTPCSAFLIMLCQRWGVNVHFGKKGLLQC